ncbi:MAG: hypothetical protein V1844_23130 [Pseudomonadota bacterium]
MNTYQATYAERITQTGRIWHWLGRVRCRLVRPLTRHGIQNASLRMAFSGGFEFATYNVANLMDTVEICHVISSAISSY